MPNSRQQDLLNDLENLSIELDNFPSVDLTDIELSANPERVDRPLLDCYDKNSGHIEAATGDKKEPLPKSDNKKINPQSSPPPELQQVINELVQNALPSLARELESKLSVLSKEEIEKIRSQFD